MANHVDIAIIGAGPGGYSAALRASQLGKSVALVEQDPVLGGTCLNRGCIPSKALITATRSIDTIHFAEQFGVHAQLDNIDFGALRDYRLRIVDTMTKGLSGLLAARGVVVYQGVANLASDAHSVLISPSQGETEVLRFEKAGVGQSAGSSYEISADDIVLATGSRPRPLPHIPFQGGVIDSTQALEINQFPLNAVIVGAGAVAVEFASMWNAAGCKVTLLIRKDRVLSHLDRRSGVTLTRELRRRGVTIITQAEVTNIETGVNLGATVHYTQNDSQENGHVYGEVVLAAIGRDPNTDADWFNTLNITRDGAGLVLTDEYGRTNIPGLWALGDITPGAALAHRAFEQGLTVAESICGIPSQPVRNETIPQIVFSSPELASVGFTLEEAQQNDSISNAKETAYPMLSNARMLMGSSGGSMSVITGEYADQPGVEVVCGVHMVADHASELIAEGEQLVGNKIPLHQASGFVHPHPTLSEAFGEALLKADGRPLHTR